MKTIIVALFAGLASANLSCYQGVDGAEATVDTQQEGCEYCANGFVLLDKEDWLGEKRCMTKSEMQRYQISDEQPADGCYDQTSPEMVKIFKPAYRGLFMHVCFCRDSLCNKCRGAECHTPTKTTLKETLKVIYEADLKTSTDIIQ